MYIYTLFVSTDDNYIYSEIFWCGYLYYFKMWIVNYNLLLVMPSPWIIYFSDEDVAGNKLLVTIRI